MTTALTLQERATNYDTFRHIERVRNLINQVVVELLQRAEKHDQSKLAPPEVAGFAEYTDKLAGVTYGSDQYNQYRAELAPILAHHYAHNRHHPEHFRNGISGMNLIDLIEMLVDWKASSERHTDGNLRHSITKNADRFNMPPAIVQLLENTVELLDQ